jgi:ubiquinone/menaquinone biosynthesis C-methylase UbiE
MPSRFRGLSVLALCFLTLGLAAPLAQAQEQTVRPGINRAYQGADFAHWQGVFETEGREVYEHRQRIIDALDLQPGMAVADVGAGTGVFSVLLARKVGPTGRVVAQDIAPGFIAGIARRAEAENLAQLVAQLGAERDAQLPANRFDLIFTSDTYHHFEYPQTMLASLKAALKPGGRLIVIDYERIPGRSSPWMLGHVRADRETVTEEITAAGFQPLRSHDFLRENYFLEFLRP